MNRRVVGVGEGVDTMLALLCLFCHFLMFSSNQSYIDFPNLILTLKVG